MFNRILVPSLALLLTVISVFRLAVFSILCSFLLDTEVGYGLMAYVVFGAFAVRDIKELSEVWETYFRIP